jgi:hypothetical protein
MVDPAVKTELSESPRLPAQSDIVCSFLRWRVRNRLWCLLRTQLGKPQALLPRIANYSDTSTSWSQTATSREHGLPSQPAREGLGSERDTSLLKSTPETRLWMRISKHVSSRGGNASPGTFTRSSMCVSLHDFSLTFSSPHRLNKTEVFKGANEQFWQRDRFFLRAFNQSRT